MATRSVDAATRRMVVLSLAALAVLVPFACVVIGPALLMAARGRPLLRFPEPGVTLVRAVIAGLPMVVLAALAPVLLRSGGPAASRRLRMAAVTGCLLTLALWGWYYADAYLAVRAGKGGANIGLGLLLLASPVLIGVAMTIAYRRASHGR